MKQACLAGLLLALGGLVGAEQDSRRKPNVLFIVVDDLNTSLGCYGHPLVKTPNIDRLASRGVRFDRAYCQGPWCAPSRASFLSGRRCDATGGSVKMSTEWSDLKDSILLPEHFRNQGYFTAHVGKISHGRFEESLGKKGVWDFSSPIQAGYSHRSLGPKPSGRSDEEEPDGKVAREIVKLLEQDRNKPFFIATGFHRPHLHFIAPDKYFKMYPPAAIPLPPNPPDGLKGIPPSALSTSTHLREAADDQRKESIAAYYACISFMDGRVGVVLDALDRLKLWESTVVVFTSDHGFQLGEHGGLFGKPSLFEGVAQVPLIVAAPGKQRGAASPRLVELVDLYPTLADLCGLPLPPGLEGTSFVPLLGKPDLPWKRAAFTGERGKSVRTERYRYCEWDGGGLLYDYQTDPQEQANLIHDPRGAQALREMRQILKEGWRAAVPTGTK